MPACKRGFWRIRAAGRVESGRGRPEIKRIRWNIGCFPLTARVIPCRWRRVNGVTLIEGWDATVSPKSGVDASGLRRQGFALRQRRGSTFRQHRIQLQVYALPWCGMQRELAVQACGTRVQAPEAGAARTMVVRVEAATVVVDLDMQALAIAPNANMHRGGTAVLEHVGQRLLQKAQQVEAVRGAQLH